MNMHVEWKEPREFLKLRRKSNNNRNKNRRVLLFIFFVLLFFLPNYIIWLYKFPRPALNVYLFFIFNVFGSFFLSAIIINVRFFTDLMGNTVVFDDNTISLRGSRQKKWSYKNLDAYRFNVLIMQKQNFEVLEIINKNKIESLCLNDSVNKNEISRIMELKNIKRQGAV